MKTSFCVRGATTVPGLTAFPILEMLSRSRSASDRALFVRVLGDYSACLRDGQEGVPEDWLEALKFCLENVPLKEHPTHLAARMQVELNISQPTISQRYVGRALCEVRQPVSAKEITEAKNEKREPNTLSARPQRAVSARPEEVRTSHAPAEDTASLIRFGDLDALVDLASNPVARLEAEQITALVVSAREALESSNDKRLAIAILARNPIRIEMAPLFLEASSDQRWAIVLAAQRAELGRRNIGAFATVGRETIASLEYAAITGDSLQFNDLLGRAIGATSELAKRIAIDPTGEPLVMALIAIGAPNDVCVRILAAHDMQERGYFRRLHTLSRLSDCASPQTARRILSAIVSSQIQLAAAFSSETKATAHQTRTSRAPFHPEPLPPMRDVFNLKRQALSARSSQTS